MPNTQSHSADTVIQADHEYAFASVHALPAEKLFPKVPEAGAPQEGDVRAGAMDQDPWAATVATLQRLSSVPVPIWNVPDPVSDACSETSFRGQPVEPGLPGTVTVLAPLTDALLVLTGHGHPPCRYEVQVLSHEIARTPGRCTYSGHPIRKGDAIYRLLMCGGTALLNSSVMILASVLLKVREG